MGLDLDYNTPLGAGIMMRAGGLEELPSGRQQSPAGLPWEAAISMYLQSGPTSPVSACYMSSHAMRDSGRSKELGTGKVSIKAGAKWASEYT